MTNNFLNFITLDVDGSPVLNEQGVPILLPRPDTKTTDDVERLIALGKPIQVIQKFAELVVLGKQWNWAEEYQEYLIIKSQIEEHNRSLPDPVRGDDGQLVYEDPLPLPEDPEDLPSYTVEDVLNPYAITLFKNNREQLVADSVVEANGFSFDGDNNSIQKMANKILSYVYSGKDDKDTLYWSLANTGTGVMTEVTLGDLKQAHCLAVDYVQSVWGIE